MDLFVEVASQGIGELGRHLTFCAPLGYLWVFTLQMNTVQ